MIIAGRWAYKKYKKHQAEKKELENTTQAKHDELLRATQDEISNTAVDRLRTFPSSSFTDNEMRRSHSQPPPSYSGIDHSDTADTQSLTSPSSTLDTASMTTSTTATTSPSVDSKAHEMLLDSPQNYHPRPHYQLLSPSQIHLPPGLPPTPAKPSYAPQQPAAGLPAEIQVRGKWVWISEDGAVPAAPPSPANQPTPRDVAMNDGSVTGAVELPVETKHPPRPSPAELPPFSPESDSDSEERHARRGFLIAELDGRSVPASNFDKEVYAR